MSVQKVNDLFQRDWEWRMKTSPEYSTLYGRTDYCHLLDDRSPEYFERKAEHSREVLKELESIDVDSLPSDADKHNYRLFKDQHETFLEGFRYKAYLMPVQLLEGPHNELLQLKDAVVFETKKDYEDYIARMKGVGKWMDQLIQCMQLGIDSKRVLPSLTLMGVSDSISAQISEDPQKSAFYEPFLRIPEGVKGTEELKKDMIKVVGEVINPALQKFLCFFTDTYSKAAPNATSCKNLPDGGNMYKQCLKFHTSTDMTPEEVHETGLSEVKRIRKEIQAVIEEVGFNGDIKQFIDYLKTDTKFQFPSSEALLSAYRAQCKEIDPFLSKLFKKLPRNPYGVKETPAEYAPGSPAAYYTAGSADGRKPGWIFVNTYKLDTRYSFEMQPLCLHEAVPGHHLQLTYTMEMENVPLFRTSAEDRKYFESPGRYPLHSAYIEGWGLYSEGLGKELGLYKDPYSRMGRLTYDMLRSCRLVVDSGLHWHGWSYEQAIAFMMENTALGAHSIDQEVRRYIAWPGQSCGYKIGEIQIRRMRARAEAALGSKFDIRDFHEVVLECGPAPMKLLDNLVSEYIARKDAQSAT
eukprot:Nk52_evm56s215 gene=Nk52_evmTU56s215